MIFVSIFVLIISSSFQHRDGYSNVPDKKDSHLIDLDGGNIDNDKESSHPVVVDHDNMMVIDHDNDTGKIDND